MQQHFGTKSTIGETATMASGMDLKSAGERLIEFSQGFFRVLDLIYVHEKTTTRSGSPRS
jgi:hypothetical protein